MIKIKNVKKEFVKYNKKNYSRHFKKELSQKEIVQYIINTDNE